MTILTTRLSALDAEGIQYELDFVTMTDGFVYRRATVLQHDETGLFITSEIFPETYLKASEIASFRIVRI